MKQNQEKKLAIFEGKKIRRIYDEKQEKWYFSVVDVVAVLTGSVNSRDFWFKKSILNEIKVIMLLY